MEETEPVAIQDPSPHSTVGWARAIGTQEAVWCSNEPAWNSSPTGDHECTENHDDLVLPNVEFSEEGAVYVRDKSLSVGVEALASLINKLFTKLQRARDICLEKLRDWEPDELMLPSYNDPRQLAFFVETSSKGGIDIKIGSDTIYVRKYESAHHPLVQMLLFAEELSSDKFRIATSLVSKTIIGIFEKSSSSTSPNMYEAGWFPEKCRPKSNEESLPVLFDACGKSEPSSTATTGTRALANKLPEVLTGGNHGAQLAVDGDFSDRHALVNGINMDSMITEIGCDLTVVAPEESLHEQHILDNPSGSNGNTSIIHSAQKDVHEIHETELGNHSADTGVTEHHVIKEEDNTASTWVVASAAPHHVTGNRGLLFDFTPEHDLFLQAGDGESMQICGRGSLNTNNMYEAGFKKKIYMYEAGWVPAKCRPKSQSVATPEDPSVRSNGRSNEASLPVLFDACGKSEPSSTATTGTGSLANKLPEVLTGDNHGAQLVVDGNFSDRHGLVNGINMDSMITEIGCDLTVLPPEKSLHEQNILDNPSGSNNNTSIIHSAQKDVHEICETELGNNRSSADTGFTEHHVIKEEDNTVATWVVASAAPRHATGNRGLLSDFTPEHDLFVHAGDGEPMQICGRGSVITDAVVLPDVYYVPGLTKNLVSASQLTELDYCVGFARGSCFIRRMTDSMIIGKASLGEDGLFPLDYLKVPLVI